MVSALGPTLQTGMATLSSSGLIVVTLVTLILVLGPAFVVAAVIFLRRERPVDEKSRADIGQREHRPGAVVLRFRRKLPHLETSVPADVTEVSPHVDARNTGDGKPK